jgi:hypothetical protein
MYIDDEENSFKELLKGFDLKISKWIDKFEVN